MGFENIKAVFLDIDNTLLDFNKGARESMRICFEKFGLEFGDEVFPVFLRINDGLWRKIESGELTREKLHEIRWQLILNELGIDFDGIKMEKAFLDELRCTAVPVEGAFELLEYLKSKNYIICAASNAPYVQQLARLEHVGMTAYFDKLFISEKIGFPKPEKAFFDACFRELCGINVKEVVMIGDSLTADIYGGMEYGLGTIWFNFENKQVPAGLGIDAIVYRLSEICDVL